MKLYRSLYVLALACTIVCSKDSNFVIKSKMSIYKGENLIEKEAVELNGPVHDISLVDNSNKIIEDYPIIKRANDYYKLSDNRLDAFPYSITKLSPSKHFILTDEPNGTRMLTFAELNLNSVDDTGLIVTKFNLPNNTCNSVKGFETIYIYFAAVLCSNNDSKKSIVYLVALNKLEIYKKDKVVLEYDLNEKFDDFQIAAMNDYSFAIVLNVNESKISQFLTINVAFKDGEFVRNKTDPTISVKEHTQITGADLY